MKTCKHTEKTEGCNLCDIKFHPKYVHMFMGDKKKVDVSSSVPQTKQLDCIHLGEPAPVPEKENPLKVWRNCEVGKGTVCPCGACQNCSQYSVVQPKSVTTVRTISPIGFNPSIIEWNGSLIFAYRTNWFDSNLYIGELDYDLQLKWQVLLITDHPMCHYGMEDPRLFINNGKLNLSFTGIEKTDKGQMIHVLVGEISESFKLENVHYYHYSHRTLVEKNWIFFTHPTGLYCLYSHQPEYKIALVDDVLSMKYVSTKPIPWKYGEIRGGASPVLVDGLYYHWFHSVKKNGDLFMYYTGVLTFMSVPPFSPVYITEGPVWTADSRRRVVKNKDVIFPGGAVYSNGEWLVAAGHQDCECYIGKFSHTEIISSLKDVK